MGGYSDLKDFSNTRLHYATALFKSILQMMVEVVFIRDQREEERTGIETLVVDED